MAGQQIDKLSDPSATNPHFISGKIGSNIINQARRTGEAANCVDRLGHGCNDVGTAAGPVAGRTVQMVGAPKKMGLWIEVGGS